MTRIDVPLRLSVVVPIYNEGGLVVGSYHRIVEVLDQDFAPDEYEIVFVDDGSRDDSFAHLSALARECPSVRVIRLARNYGAHMAVRAGLDHARGECVCFLACDLQDPPEMIPKMYAELTEEIQIVWAVRQRRGDPALTRFCAGAFYRLGRWLVSPNLPPQGASMFLLGPAALTAVRSFRDRHLTLEGLFATLGFRQAFVPCHRQPRQAGRSKWTLAKKTKLLIDFFVSYSYAPIRVMWMLGGGVFLAGILLLCGLLAAYAFGHEPVPLGLGILAAGQFAGFGVVMVFLGILGEYVWRTLDESRDRPRYLIQTILGAEPPCAGDERSAGIPRRVTSSSLACDQLV